MLTQLVRCLVSKQQQSQKSKSPCSARPVSHHPGLVPSSLPSAAFVPPPDAILRHGNFSPTRTHLLATEADSGFYHHKALSKQEQEYKKSCQARPRPGSAGYLYVNPAQCGELGTSLGTVRPWVRNNEGETTTDKILDWIKSELGGG